LIIGRFVALAPVSAAVVENSSVAVEGKSVSEALSTVIVLPEFPSSAFDAALLSSLAVEE